MKSIDLKSVSPRGLGTCLLRVPSLWLSLATSLAFTCSLSVTPVGRHHARDGRAGLHAEGVNLVFASQHL
eukprot:1261786-Rhodomonas_salina.2